jgi:hypothetical protein
MKHLKSQGFTLVEVTASSTILVMALALAVGGYMFTLSNVNDGDTQNDLDIDVQIAMESLKKDLRLSSLDTIFYYPAGSGPYQAISFPVAYDSDGDGILERDDDGKILWDETVIYHVRPTTPHQLVKTVFSPRDNTLTDAQRQAQLNDVVKDGTGDDTFNGLHSSSDVLFANLLEWEINPKAGRFDAYADVMSRDRAQLGYILLDPGEHKIAFKVIGRNAASKGFNIGLDQLTVSGSASYREAEAQLPPAAQSGAVARNQYMPAGSWKGKHQLLFPATSIGNSFTLLMENDRWEETNFSGLNYKADDTIVRFDEKATGLSDYVVQLDGKDDTWKATEQTGSESVDSPLGVMQNWVVRVLQKGSELADNGNWFAYNSRQCRLKFDAAKTGNFRVTNVFIGESSSSTNATFDFNTAMVVPVMFGGNIGSPIVGPGGQIVSDWTDFEIDKDKNYLVSYRIANSADRCHPAIWQDTRGNESMTCLVVTNGSVATAKDKTWSDRAGIDPVEVDGIIGLASIEASYPESGTYDSQIFDTHMEAPQYKDIDWNAELPYGTKLAFKVRTGDKEDLSDAPAWDTVGAFTTPRALSVAYKRYVQFQAIMVSSPDGHLTPKLKDVTIDWEGEQQLVDIGGIFTKGPDYGIFEISIDGQPLRSALIVDLEIYKDITVEDAQQKRITSSLKVEVAPRNSGL